MKLLVLSIIFLATKVTTERRYHEDSGTSSHLYVRALQRFPTSNLDFAGQSLRGVPCKCNALRVLSIDDERRS